MAADTSSRPGALVEQPQRPKGIPEAERARRRDRLQAQGEPDPANPAGEATAELTPPPELAADLEHNDRQVQRIGTLCSVPRLAAQAQAAFIDATSVGALLEQLVDLRLHLENGRPVPAKQVLAVGGTWRAWLTARHISESDPPGAA